MYVSNRVFAPFLHVLAIWCITGILTLSENSLSKFPLPLQQSSPSRLTLPPRFVAMSSGVGFQVLGSSAACVFDPSGITLSFQEDSHRHHAPGSLGQSLRLRFENQSSHARLLAAEPTGASLMRYGRHGAAATRTSIYHAIEYSQVWPGIDARFKGSSDHIKCEFRVAPFADAHLIRTAYRGPQSMYVDSLERLQIIEAGREFSDEKPSAYQIINGAERRVDAAYCLMQGTKAASVDGAYSVGFQLGSYDPRYTLVIDPALPIDSRLLDLSGAVAQAIALDSAGNAYVTGYSINSTAPSPSGVALTNPGAEISAFIAKIRTDSLEIAYLAVIDGVGRTYGSGVSVDSSGSAYVVGSTTADERSFPVNVGPSLHFASTQAIFPDAFIAKVSPDGSRLEYCGYIGGAGTDNAVGVAVTASNHAYVVGTTNSLPNSFPVKLGPTLTFGGEQAGFLARVSPTGDSLDYCGYIANLGQTYATGVATDGQENAYMCGLCDGVGQAAFPKKTGPSLRYSGGFFDAFVAKVGVDAKINYCGYIGGSGDDEAWAIAVDPLGDAFVTGATTSKQSSFPVRGGPDLTANHGPVRIIDGSPIFSYDAWVAKVRPDGRALSYCGYIGGHKSQFGVGIAVDGDGRAIVVGQTSSPDFPRTPGSGSVYHRGADPEDADDAFVARVSPNGRHLDLAVLLGGACEDRATSVATDASGVIYAAGITFSGQAFGPHPSQTAASSDCNSGNAFIARITAP